MRTCVEIWPLALLAIAVAAQVACGQARTSFVPAHSIAALQAALDRQGFGVGCIDDEDGARTQVALRDYCQARGLSEAVARQALTADGNPAFFKHIVTTQELAEVGAAPADWLEASQAPRMACESLEGVLSEKYHVSEDYLRLLNPQVKDWHANLAGVAVIVPNSTAPRRRRTACRIEVDCRLFRLRAFDDAGQLAASFPCSIAMDRAKIPTGELHIASAAANPTYTFDPANYPESPRAQEIGKRLIIPAGPRTPVGVYWLGLNLPGFGIHGTNHPETIGRSESHGCFRLTNWDILKLAGMVKVGTPVTVLAAK